MRLSIIYLDSYNFLGLSTPGFHLFTNDSIDDLEHLKKGTPDRPAILALFTDFLETHSFIVRTFHVCVHLLIYTTSRSSLMRPWGPISMFKYCPLPMSFSAASRRYSAVWPMSLVARKHSLNSSH